jgi:hypothetical protein
MPEAMDMILATLAYVTQEAKAWALQRITSVTKGSQRPISQHIIKSHNIAYQVFEDLLGHLNIFLVLSRVTKTGRNAKCCARPHFI